MKSKADIRMRGFLKRTPVKTLLALIKEHSQLLSSEDILTVEASGRILAQEIISPVNSPNRYSATLRSTSHSSQHFHFRGARLPLYS